jgi:hypothetical protein
MSVRPRVGVALPFGRTDGIPRTRWSGSLTQWLGWHSGWSTSSDPTRPSGSSGFSDRPWSGWHAYRPMVGAPMPAWVVELALSIERPLDRSLDGLSEPRALLLAQAASWPRLLVDALSDAVRGVDLIAGTSPPLPSLRLVPPRSATGFEGVARSDVMGHLGLANERGRTTGGRRTRTERARAACWEPGAGAGLTCRSQVGISAQAVVAVHGDGDPASLRPPPGGAVVLRAWRCPRRHRQAAADGGQMGDQHRSAATRGDQEAAEWALTAGVVVAAASGHGLGRVARRHAREAEAVGWNVTVPTGSAALAFARAGDPRYPPPTSLAQRVSSDAVMALLTSCLAASARQVDRPALPRP